MKKYESAKKKTLTPEISQILVYAPLVSPHRPQNYHCFPLPYRRRFFAIISHRVKREASASAAVYRVVTGMYSAQMLGTVKSRSMGLLSLEPKMADGSPVIDFEDCMVRYTPTRGKPEVPSPPTPMDSTSKAMEVVISPVARGARSTPSAVTVTVGLEPKMADGSPVIDFEDCILRDVNGNEIKEWYALAAYLQSFGEEGVPARYAQPDGRKDVSRSWSPIELVKNPNWITLAALLIRSCIHKRKCWMDQEFFRPARQKTAGILCGFQDFLTQQGGKHPPG